MKSEGEQRRNSAKGLAAVPGLRRPVLRGAIAGIAIRGGTIARTRVGRRGWRALVFVAWVTRVGRLSQVALVFISRRAGMSRMSSVPLVFVGRRTGVGGMPQVALVLISWRA